jgi:hypothetical protein
MRSLVIGLVAVGLAASRARPGIGAYGLEGGPLSPIKPVIMLFAGNPVDHRREVWSGIADLTTITLTRHSSAEKNAQRAILSILTINSG